MTTLPKRYRDLDLNFTRNPSTGDVTVRSNEQAIIRAVRNLLFINHYEKPFHPEIGSSVRQFLFENVTSITAQNLKKAIETTIQNYEPRVDLRDVFVQARGDQNGFDVRLVFYILNSVEPITVDFFLERIR